MLGIRQSEVDMSNKELYKTTGQIPISTQVRQRQLQFIRHCLRMPNNEPANIYALYSSSHQSNVPSYGYLNQISASLTSDKKTKLTAKEISKYEMIKSNWNKSIAALNKPDRWWWWWSGGILIIRNSSKNYMFYTSFDRSWCAESEYVLFILYI